MSDYWFVYDLSTGALCYPGTGPDGVADAQVLQDGRDLVAMPFVAYTALSGPSPDFEPLKVYVRAMVDEAAGTFRKRYITDIPGQEATYLKKAEQAKAWMAATAPDPAAPAYRYLRREADATGRPIAEVAATIAAAADLWEDGDAKIEGARLGAKAAITAATNIGQIVSAARIDWNSVIAA